MILTPEQASEIIGVPAVQLRRWAYLDLGPHNSGTKLKPMFDEDELRRWKITSRRGDSLSYA
jgi:hypothetical protein